MNTTSQAVQPDSSGPQAAGAQPAPGRTSRRHADGGPRRWGSRNHDFPKFCSGPKSGPKAPFGVKIGGTDAENREESKKRFKKYFKKIYLFVIFQIIFGLLAVFCVGSTDFHPKRCLGGRFWAKTKFWKITIFRPPFSLPPIRGSLIIGPLQDFKIRGF